MIFGWFLKIFKKKDSSQEKSDSIDSLIDSLDSSSTHNRLDETRSETKSYQELSRLESDSSPKETKDTGKLEFERDSVQLGLAAGYTSHFIRNIESSLHRIESLMITKDWFENKDKSSQLLELLSLVKASLESHDKKVDEGFDQIQDSLERLDIISKKAPEPIKSELETEIKRIESKIPLSSQMNVIMNTIKQHGEISYKELTSALGYKSVDSLRSYLSKMRKRGAQIEAFDKNNETWVRVESSSTESTNPTRVNETSISGKHSQNDVESNDTLF